MTNDGKMYVYTVNGWGERDRDPLAPYEGDVESLEELLFKAGFEPEPLLTVGDVANGLSVDLYACRDIAFTAPYYFMSRLNFAGSGFFVLLPDLPDALAWLNYTSAMVSLSIETAAREERMTVGKAAQQVNINGLFREENDPLHSGNWQ